MLQLVDGAAHDGVDVLVGEGVGAAAGDAGEALQLGLDRREGAVERVAFGGQVDVHDILPSDAPQAPGISRGEGTVAPRRASSPGVSAGAGG